MDYIEEFYSESDLSLLDKMSLIIPTYNRNYYLSRCLWYHAHFPFGEIIVADSSPEEKKAINRKTVSKVSDLFDIGIQYLEYPPETDKYGGDIYLKWKDAVDHVSTEYCAICGDKEFLIPTTSVKCIKYLDQNIDYGSAEGVHYALRNYRSKIIYEKVHILSTNSLDYSDPIVRLFAMTSECKISSNLKAIRRTEDFKYYYQKCYEYGLYDLRFGEFTLEFLTTIRSKVKYFSDSPYICHDFSKIRKNLKVNKAESSNIRYPKLNQYISDGIYSDLMNLEFECLSDEIIANNCVLTKDEIKKLLSQVIPFCLNRRGFYGEHNALIKVPFFKILYPIYFAIVKPLVQSCSGSKPLSLKLNSPEIDLIMQYFNETDMNYNSDLPLSIK